METLTHACAGNKRRKIDYSLPKHKEFMPPFRLGRKNKNAVLDANGLEIIVFPEGSEFFAEKFCIFANKEQKTNENIICAAIHFQDIEIFCNGRSDVCIPIPSNISTGFVVCGFRHYDIKALVRMFANVDWAAHPTVEGFLTNKNRFVNREEAAQIALAAGQIAYKLKELKSEDLW